VLLQDILEQIPHEIAGLVPEAAARIRENERRMCQSPDFSAERLRESVAFTDNQERR
jgi:hypothetical protein